MERLTIRSGFTNKVYLTGKAAVCWANRPIEERAFCTGCHRHKEMDRTNCGALMLVDRLSALRGPTREMVERMFPGCEKCKSVCHRCLNYPVALYPKACRTCVEHSNYESASNFCEDCGKPLTDEAVQMVMERLEALNDGESD